MIKKTAILVSLLLLLLLLNIIFCNGVPLFQKSAWQTIFFQFRLPRALTAFCAGGVLSIAGLLMQNIFKNPLAGPDILGISQAASLAVAISILSNFAFGGIIIAAIIGSCCYLFLLILLSKHISNSTTLLLIGVMSGFLFSAIISTMQSFSAAENIKSYVMWGMGSFAKNTPNQAIIFLIVTPLLFLFAMFHAQKFDLLLLGNQKASMLGLNVSNIFIIAVLVAGVATGISAAFCGPVAFVGLAAPHLCKMWFATYSHKWLITACFFMGASITLFADLLASSLVSDIQFPLNAMLSILAAPVILWVIIKRRNEN